ncbi:hypothetical protein BGZ51_006417 [Haplosporangium sp. Z 767]|nr:hypothetical protein BGZ51_006417 [Haplosporangium sp. Z 767]KAF9183101.1 hypothetical protein BGZ50_004435 [Haplosporangium sp. Z 11]
MLGQQQTSNHRKSMESNGGNSNSNSSWTSPQTSSFSRMQDFEVPLGGTTELNDDAKEKSLRRRSLLDERAARRRSLLNYANAPGGADDGDRRRSSNNSSNLASPSKLRPSGQSSLLGVVESHQAAPLPSLLKVSADSFEQWLKLATDNKINANNSWNFALIDYFHEMSLLREGDSINFQKASCTLDGCVKIYTSRVDSVATETTKLLGGLATSSKGHGGDGADDDDDVDEEQDKPVKKKHSSRSGNTLAKDFSVLSLEKFNLEFSVDPLFKKTSADFDEGGARGLLLNHLNVDAEGKIIFDAGDARDEGDDDDDEEADDDEEEAEKEPASGDEEAGEQRDEEKKSKRKTDVEAAMIDIQRLRSRFLPSLNQIFEKDICPSLKDFQLSGSTELNLSFLKRFHDDADDEGADDNENDDDIINPIDDYDYDDDFGQADLYDDVPDQGQESIAMAVDQQQVDGHTEDAFGDLDEQIALQRAGPSIDNNLMIETDEILVKGHTDMYSYFDSALLRNWAGPEHWKLRRVPKEKAAATAATAVDGATPTEEETGGPKKRSGKVPLVINFTEAEEVDEDELFAPAEASSLMFTPANEAEHQKSKHILPDDIHFSSKQLLRMFMKPSFIIKSKTRKHQPGYLQQPEEPESFNQAFPDEQFWATHTNNINDGDMEDLTNQMDQTQIYNDYVEDDEDDYGYQDQSFFTGVGGEGVGLGALGGIGLGLDGDGNDYASQLVTQPKRVKASFISFSKTAKKVDVKKLKDNIWKEMTQQSLKRQPGDKEHDRGRSKKRANLEGGDGSGAEDEDGQANEENENEDEDEDGVEYVKKEQKFTEIIGGLSKVYPEQKLKDISVPFCFICLLHLANEKNLAIEGTENLSELVIRQG